MATRQPRKTRRTLLIVTEGESQAAFLKHLQQHPAVREAGTAITIKNAHGKGKQYLIHTALKTASHARFNQVALLLDADTDENAETSIRAGKQNIRIIYAISCLEAVLLRAIREYKLEADMKAQLARLVPDATDFQSYRQQFPYPRLHIVRRFEKALDEVMGVLGIG
ncbi:MAG: hypothetical protein LBM56_02310 [Burkholderiaceae bacterium]|jgi:hypothetical protein|nr:hypothetical protein [Burkholderiaceae bacterium]